MTEKLNIKNQMLKSSLLTVWLLKPNWPLKNI